MRIISKDNTQAMNLFFPNISFDMCLLFSLPNQSLQRSEVESWKRVEYYVC